MNPTMEGCVIAAQDKLDAAILALENHAHGGHPRLLGDVTEHLFHVRGQLAALRQFAELQAIERAPTEPPLRVVR